MKMFLKYKTLFWCSICIPIKIQMFFWKRKKEEKVEKKGSVEAEERGQRPRSACESLPTNGRFVKHWLPQAEKGRVARGIIWDLSSMSWIWDTLPLVELKHL